MASNSRRNRRGHRSRSLTRPDHERVCAEMTSISNPQQHHWTIEEYYALERGSDRRYEYWEGEIVCMSGGSREHGILSANLHGLLYNVIRNNGCRTFTEGQAVKAPLPAPGYVYPDVSASCGPIFEQHEERGRERLTNPVLIVEVTSTTSGIRDHNRKRTAYQLIETMRDYLIIEPD